MPSGSQATQRARITPPRTESRNSLEALPVHSRLPRLDLGVDWESPWEEFRSSVGAFFLGPRPLRDATPPKNSPLRVDWIEGKMPRSAFVASSLWHVAIVMILLLPIWGFLAHASTDSNAYPKLNSLTFQRRTFGQSRSQEISRSPAPQESLRSLCRAAAPTRFIPGRRSYRSPSRSRTRAKP